jgi:hypothetical protein
LRLGRADGAGVKIYNARGECVRDLFRDRLDPGANLLEWTGCDDGGRTAASGVYFARVVTGGRTLVGRVDLVRWAGSGSSTRTGAGPSNTLRRAFTASPSAS